ncbi:MAG: biotin--[acetyl-CoA-carboxylase] ligase [Planctomycetes bacterium]|jgi:BirA family biotin operon repressor/biotin-[acetyl-CoA-carboxylase] ligase|nr:biotin--[acetyl-CoA-carboxylase] ligase [Planctomycetota bacterium]
MTDAARVLEVLYDSDHVFCSLPDLCSRCGVSRKRLMAAIEVLGHEGQLVELSPHGARLKAPAALNAQLIERGLKNRRVGGSVLCFSQVGSTNDVAFDAAQRAECDGLAVFAERQTSGRGRFGRQWVSEPGANLLASVLLIDESIPHDAVTIASGLAVAEAVENSAGVHCRLKWPNDVLIGDAKVAGVLVETRKVNRRRCLVIGIGINVNASPQADSLRRPATSIAQHVEHVPRRIEIARELLSRLDHWVGVIEAGRLDDIHGPWLDHCDMINSRVGITCSGRQYVGRVLDIDPTRGLCLSLDSGQNVFLPASFSTMDA